MWLTGFHWLRYQTYANCATYNLSVQKQVCYLWLSVHEKKSGEVSRKEIEKHDFDEACKPNESVEEEKKNLVFWRGAKILLKLRLDNTADSNFEKQRIPRIHTLSGMSPFLHKIVIVLSSFQV